MFIYMRGEGGEGRGEEREERGGRRGEGGEGRGEEREERGRRRGEKRGEGRGDH